MKAPQTLDRAHTSQRSEVDTSFDLGGSLPAGGLWALLRFLEASFKNRYFKPGGNGHAQNQAHPLSTFCPFALSAERLGMPFGLQSFKF